jgi:protein SCO1/2
MFNSTLPIQRLFVLALLAVVSIGLGIWLGQRLSADRASMHAPLTVEAGTVFPQPRAIRDFALTDQEGNPFTLADLRDHWSFLFFGYTHCPDVCPMALSAMREVFTLLGETSRAQEHVQMVFVSVDPSRDTPEQLRSYVEYFHPEFIGVSGEETQLQALTRQLSIVYMKVPGTTAEDYLIEHSAVILLVDPQARVYAVFSSPYDPMKISTAFRQIRQHYEADS